MTHHDPHSGNLGAGSAPGARGADVSLNTPQPPNAGGIPLSPPVSDSAR